MTVIYQILETVLPFSWLDYNFMKNAFVAILLITPLLGVLGTMAVNNKMAFFSDALGHSGFTGIAIGVLCGAALPIVWAVGVAVLFALLFSYVRARTNQAADTVIGVFSSTAVALGIFIVTLGGRSFTKFNRYLIGDILSVSPQEIGLLALVLAAEAKQAFTILQQEHEPDADCWLQEAEQLLYALTHEAAYNIESLQLD